MWLLHNLSHMSKPLCEVSNQNNINQAVRSQKKARSFKTRVIIQSKK